MPLRDSSVSSFAWLFIHSPHLAFQHNPTSAPSLAPRTPPCLLSSPRCGWWSSKRGATRTSGDRTPSKRGRGKGSRASWHCSRVIYDLPRVANAAFRSFSGGGRVRYSLSWNTNEKKKKASDFLGPQSHLLQQVILRPPPCPYIYMLSPCHPLWTQQPRSQLPEGTTGRVSPCSLQQPPLHDVGTAIRSLHPGCLCRISGNFGLHPLWPGLCSELALSFRPQHPSNRAGFWLGHRHTRPSPGAHQWSPHQPGSDGGLPHRLPSLLPPRGLLRGGPAPGGCCGGCHLTRDHPCRLPGRLGHQQGKTSAHGWAWKGAGKIRQSFWEG